MLKFSNWILDTSRPFGEFRWTHDVTGERRITTPPAAAEAIVEGCVRPSVSS